MPVDISFHNAYPEGLVNAAAAGMTNSCGGTTLANAGADFLALTDGTIPPNAQCEVTVHVTSATAGAYVNELPAEATFSEDAGIAAGIATSTLLVSAATIPTASEYALLAMALALALAAWRALK